MPHGDDPDSPARDAIEEAVRCDDNLTIRKIGELGEDATRRREPLQPAQGGFRALPEPPGSGGIVTDDVRDDGKELPRA
jgi:hypothetical protein